MIYLLLLLSCIVAWLRPALGYGLFMLLQTPLSNVVESTFGHPFSADVVLVVATTSVLVRKPHTSSSWRIRAVEICALGFSLIVLVRQIELSLYFAPSQDLHILALAFLWGPLLVAFNRLDGKEMASLRFWMSVAGIVVGVWGFLIYLTRSEYLIQTGTWADLGTREVIGSLLSGSNAERLVRSRFIVMGLFTVVPSAYWYAMRSALARPGKHWLWNLVMWAGLGTILLAVGISVTRSTALLLVGGTGVMLGSLALIRGMRSRGRVRTLAIIATGACLFGVAVRQLDLTTMADEFRMRLSTLGVDDVGVAARLDATANAWDYIENNFVIFGAPGPDPLANYRGEGDTALVPYLWLYYGLAGVVLYSVLFFAAFYRLYKCWLLRTLSSEQELLRSMLTAWSLYFVYAWIVGYGLNEPPVAFFTVLFFSEIDRLKRTRTFNNYQQARGVA